MEVLLVRFERDQRTFIRKQAKKKKWSEAELVRHAINILMFEDESRPQQ